ncbi:hypothetical protein LX16_4183 [Stackebrandtia albiflava]|uniref:Uncharacterized protein n=1 Tax=Stackebrandtia albiflava TaxID=406432 RepID=A0A562UYP5_9ACTN|nr:hypothetical protein [Stackebrandtia albiflava]TWJ10760.1 hypothetical protein LX16_4183 [Stackebrandtia albiflava]
MGGFLDEDDRAGVGWLRRHTAGIVVLAMTTSMSVGVAAAGGMAEITDEPAVPAPVVAGPPSSPVPPVVVPPRPPAPFAQPAPPPEVPATPDPAPSPAVTFIVRPESMTGGWRVEEPEPEPVPDDTASPGGSDDCGPGLGWSPGRRWR